MKLYRHILIKILLPLALSSLIMVIVASVVISVNLNSWIDDIGASLVDAEVQHINTQLENLE